MLRWHAAKYRRNAAKRSVCQVGGAIEAAGTRGVCSAAMRGACNSAMRGVCSAGERRQCLVATRQIVMTYNY